jgi:hypothetical protein
MALCAFLVTALESETTLSVTALESETTLSVTARPRPQPRRRPAAGFEIISANHFCKSFLQIISANHF